jgi:hypothetical protein
MLDKVYKVWYNKSVGKTRATPLKEIMIMLLKDFLRSFQVYSGQDVLIEVYSEHGVFLESSSWSEYDYFLENFFESKVDVFFMSYEASDREYLVKIWLED